jgi:Holliday junction resolvasome RuvABC endonuclease subunit
MRGVICLVVEEAGVPIVPMTATTVKQRLTGSGHASKEQVQKMVLQLTGLPTVAGMKLDETDAIGLALAGLNQSILSPRPTTTSASRPHSRGAVRQHVLALLERQRGRRMPHPESDV